MKPPARFPVVLLWHMHQPHYRDALSGQYILPWTYLHAIKDYTDMAAHLEANAAARAVVNFTPVLIEQIEELAQRVEAYLQHGQALPDPVLALLTPAPMPADPASRLALLQACLKANRQRLIEPYPRYAALADMALQFATLELIPYAADAYLRDLAVWYHIAWLGETVKRADARVAMLIAQGQHFTPLQCRTLLELIGELLRGILPRYARLAAAGRCELAVSPWGHPILPLLQDFGAARESVPACPLPLAAAYPGGARRAEWHMREARRVFTRVFGMAPSGCWPSEGAISAATLQLIDREGFSWVATSAGVLAGCLRDRDTPGAQPLPESRGWRVAAQRLACFFRHDELSDLIGFSYSNWHGDDAVAHFIAQLEAAALRVAEQPGRLLLIALDGENAWEHYPFNGYYFLQGLYAALASHPWLAMTTLSEHLSRHPPLAPLPRVVAGSWVHGTLATWMGDHDKNAGWDLLVQAKLAVDAALAGGSFSADERAGIERQLALCESSDWFWWFGDYNPREAVRDFDGLYRHQLTLLYRMLRLPEPAALAEPISVGRGTPEGGGVMRRAQG